MESHICAAALWPYVGVASERGQWPLRGLWSFVCKEAVPWDLPKCQTLGFLPVRHWCPSSCCPATGAQMEWVCVSSKSVVHPLRGDTWESCSFFHCPNYHGFLCQEVMGTYFPGIGTLGWDPSLPRYPSWFLPTIHRCGTARSTSPHLRPSYLSEWMGLFKFLGCGSSIQLDFLMILGDSSFVV